jgi:hypothetical protein
VFSALCRRLRDRSAGRHLSDISARRMNDLFEIAYEIVAFLICGLIFAAVN